MVDAFWGGVRASAHGPSGVMNHTQYHRTGHVRMKCIFTVKSMCKKTKRKQETTTT
jgi:hypothetical protein